LTCFISFVNVEINFDYLFVFQSMTAQTRELFCGHVLSLLCWLPWPSDKFTTWSASSKFEESSKTSLESFSFPLMIRVNMFLRECRIYFWIVLVLLVCVYGSLKLCILFIIILCSAFITINTTVWHSWTLCIYSLWWGFCS